MSKNDKIECPRCGQLNPPQARYCMYCGERLIENKTKKNVSSPKKELNVKVLYIVLSVLIVSGAAILYFAGVFDSPTVVIKQNAPQERTGNENATAFASPQVIDLKTLQELKTLENGLSKNPDDIQTMLILGNKYFDYGHFPEAIKFYKMYLEKEPNTPDVLVDLGVCYYNLKDYDNAILYMEKAVKINPNHQIANLNLGVVYEAKGNIEKAKKYWTKAVEINANSQFGIRARNFLNNY